VKGQLDTHVWGWGLVRKKTLRPERLCSNVSGTRALARATTKSLSHVVHQGKMGSTMTSTTGQLSESFVFLPIIVAVTTVLAMAQLPVSPLYSSPDENVADYKAMELVDHINPDQHALSDENDCDATCYCTKMPAHNGCVMNGHVVDSCYLFEEWTSSTGVFFSCFLSYFILITIVQSIACYKFISTWYLITGSLREQQYYTCLRRRNTTRRRTCQEALPVIPYRSEAATLTENGERNDEVCCPVCLVELQDCELVTLCDGCSTNFHKECLFGWLEFKVGDTAFRHHGEIHASCPCCRKELLEVSSANSAKAGWLADMSTYMGYYTR
jgi:hypothetical protein